MDAGTASVRSILLVFFSLVRSAVCAVRCGVRLLPLLVRIEIEMGGK